MAHPRPPRQSRPNAGSGGLNPDEHEFTANQPSSANVTGPRSIPQTSRIAGHNQALAQQRAREARRQAAKTVPPESPHPGRSNVTVATPRPQRNNTSNQNLQYHDRNNFTPGPANPPRSTGTFPTPYVNHQQQILNTGFSETPENSPLTTRPQSQNYDGQRNGFGPLQTLTNQNELWNERHIIFPQATFGDSDPSATMANNVNMNHEFNVSQFSNSNLGQTLNLSQEELDEMERDPDGNLNDGMTGGDFGCRLPQGLNDSDDEADRHEQEEEVANANATSGLTITRRSVVLNPRKRTKDSCREPLEQPASARTMAAAPDSPSGDEESAPRKKRKSRSIGKLQEDVQLVTNAAYDKLKSAITTVQPWPFTEESPNSVETEAERMAADAWDQACLKLDISIDIDRAARSLILERFSQFRGTLKSFAVACVASNYKLTSIADITDPTPANIEADPYNENPEEVNGMYRNPIIQRLLTKHWFGDGAHRRSHDFEGHTELPLVTVALILTAVKCAIDCWGEGAYEKKKFEREKYFKTYTQILTKLEKWATFSAQQPRNLAKEVREDLLRNARATLPSAAIDLAPVNDEDDDSMFAEFSANQG